MSGVIWLIIGGAGLLGFAVGLWAFVRGGFRAGGGQAGAEGDVRLPMTPQQRRAWWGLGIGALMTAALVAVVRAAGPASYHEDRTTRLITLAIFGAGVIAYFVMLAVTRRSAAGIVMDERDRAIVTRALAVALLAGFLTLVAWTIVLTELYWDAKAIPIDYATFILWSTFLAALLGREVGVLMGYAGWHGHGES
jgi:hypothetical protein